MKIGFLIVLFSYYTCSLISQGESNNWYFGTGAGITFNSSPSSILNNGANSFNAIEGAASISCPNGNLLFYTDGSTVFTKNHTVMSNGTGLLTYISASQGVIISPQPQTPDIFYIFYLPGLLDGNGFMYSIVDMSLNGGLGGITAKNILINSNLYGEKITSTLHSNQEDIWITVENITTANLETYLFSSSGLNTTPIISSTTIPGIVSGGVYVNRIDEFTGMKFSKIGNKFATFFAKSIRRGAITDIINYLQLFDFDNSTGVFNWYDTVALPMLLNSSGSGGTYKPYGVDFSEDGSKLYCIQSNISQTNNFLSELYQIDMLASNLSSSLSVEAVRTGVNAMVGLMRGPDDKIYIGYANSYLNTNNEVSILNTPNNSNPSFSYAHFDYTSTGKNRKTTFPQLIVGNIYYDYTSNFSYIDTCYLANTSFTLTSNKPTEIDSVKWYFGDPASGSNDSSVLQNPNHIYSTSGFFDVKLIVYYPCINDTIEKTLEIINAPLPNITGSLTFCTGDSTTIDAGTGYSSYLWSNGDNSQSINVLSAGQYSVIVTNSTGCEGYDTVNITENNSLNTSISGGLSFCPEGSTTLDAGTGFSTYLWNNGNNSQTISVNNPGEYSVIVTNTSGCIGYDTVNITTLNVQALSITGNTLFCEGDSITLSANNGFNNYLWSTNESGNSITVNQSGEVSLIAQNTNGCFSYDTVLAESFPKSNIHIYGDTMFCINSQTILSVSDGFNSYSWSNGENSLSITVNNEGKYIINAVDINGCKSSDSVYVSSTVCETDTCKIFIPNSFTPNKDGFNDFFIPLSTSCEYEIYEFYIFNRWGEIIHKSNTPNSKWDGKYKNKLCPIDVYVWMIRYKTFNDVNINTKRGHVSIIK